MLSKKQIPELEEHICERVGATPSILLLKTLPGVGNILAIVTDREIGCIDRFDTAGQLASYAGAVPTVHASGGKTRFGHMGKPSNQYLKWTSIEAANVVVRHRHHPAWKTKYMVQIHERTRKRMGHSVAVGAVAGYLAEAAYWLLKKDEPHREPVARPLAGSKSAASSKQGQAPA
jgi:transposase